MNKKILFPILFSLCSLNSINATEKTNNVKVNNKGFDTKTLVVSNVATFTLGGLAGYLGNKKLSTDKVVEENSKLKTENTTLKNKHDYENEYSAKCTELNTKNMELQNLNQQNETLKAKLKFFTDIWGENPTLADVKKGKGLCDWYNNNELGSLRDKQIGEIQNNTYAGWDNSFACWLYPETNASEDDKIANLKVYVDSLANGADAQAKSKTILSVLLSIRDFYKTLKSDLANAGANN